ncbi:diguanylate cyclase domain-containing protein [Cognatiluteimonas telluris]|uniref:diguanylate cyclase domain-containing protein n=1 Tax=Cognatiluteimonas telluris TaxID=1104775 RepID=UPI00140CA7C6
MGAWRGAGRGAARALEVAERIQAIIAEQVATPNGSDRITVSVGVASFDGAESTDGLVTRADAAMRRAKQAGRDWCVVATVTVPAPGRRPVVLDPGQCDTAASSRP